MRDFAKQLGRHQVYPSYPFYGARSKLTKPLYDHWINTGRPTGVTIGLCNYSYYAKNLCQESVVDAGHESRSFFNMQFAKSFTGPYERDIIGRPVHPYAESMLKSGVAVEDLGCYWTYGPNLTADPVVMGCGRDGYLKLLIVKRRDTGRVALPGGHVDVGEEAIHTAQREAKEETGIDLSGYDGQILYQGPVPDPRTTLNAWPETTAILFWVDDIDALCPVAGDDAAEAMIKTVDEKLFADIFPGHDEYIKIAIAVVKEQTKWQISPDGKIN